MPPKYSTYAADLAQLKEKILAVEAEFTGAMKSNMAGTKYKDSYDGLVSSFAKLQNSIAVLENPASAPEALDQEWNTLSRTLRDSAPGMPTPSEYINGSLAEFSSDMGDDNFRRLWRAYNKLTNLSFETNAMDSKGGLAQLEQDLNGYDEAKTRYTASMARITEPLEYSGYYELANLPGEYKAKADENQEYYDQMVEADIVEKTRVETTKIRVNAIQNLAIKQSELVRTEDQIEEISGELEHITDQVLEDRSNAKEIQADVHNQADRVNEVYAELNKLESDGVQYALKSTEMQEKSNQYAEELAEKEKFLAEKANATPSLFMKGSEKAMITLCSGYVKDLDTNRRLNELVRSFNSYMKTSGLQQKTPAEQEQYLKRGEAYVKAMPKSVIDHFRSINQRDVVDCYDNYLKFQQFKADFIEIYDVTNPTTLKEIEDNVKTPAEYLKLWQKGSTNVQQGLYQTLNIKDDDPALHGASGAEVRAALKEIYDANDFCNVRRTQIAEIAEHTESILRDKEKAERRRDELTDEVRRLEAEAGEHTLESKESTNKQKHEDLVAQKAELAEKSAVLRSEIQTLQDEKYAAGQKYDRVVKEQDEYLENAKQNRALYEKTSEELRKVDAVYDNHISMKQAHDKIRQESEITPTNMIGKDYLREAKQNVSFRISRFHHTIECAKKSGHTNSEEFKNMQSALERLYTNDSELRARPSVTDYVYQLTQVRNAAQAYLDAKATETRLFPSTQRKYRLDYARQLVEFTTNAAQLLGEAGAAVKANNEHIAQSGVQYYEMTNSRSEVFGTIKTTVKKAAQLREERAANAEKQRNAEVQQQKTINNPVKQPIIHG